MSAPVKTPPATGLPHPDGALPEISLPAGFHISPVEPPGVRLALPPTPTLGPLAAFVGAWNGKGFNTIFRPNSNVTPTQPLPPSDNVLELNLTLETLAFADPLGTVPNRGMGEADVFLNGVPYLQTVTDVTTAGEKTPIHAEPGLWMCVPATAEENEQTVARMASIPHGTTVNAQGTAVTFAGPPTIDAVSISPFPTQSAGTPLPPPSPPPTPPGVQRIVFASQTASNPKTARIPQDLGPYIAAGVITQAMLDDPNTFLREQISGLTITSTTAIIISTAPAKPFFGGGTDNIDFLLGSAAALTDPQAKGENAQVLQMTAIFWIETVQHSIPIPTSAGHEPLTLTPEQTHPSLPLPIFRGVLPKGTPSGRVITVESTIIQYSQTVMLNFNGLTWPHVSVAGLVPAGAIPLSAAIRP